MQIIEKIKDHPALALGAGVSLLVLIYILSHSGNGAVSAVPGGDANSVSSATALQQAAMQAASQGSIIQAQVSANADNNAAQIELAKIQAQQSGAHDQLAANVATSEVNASQQVQSLLASLSADVSKTSINADLAKTTVLSGNQTEQQRILADALIQQSRTQATVAQAGIAAANKGLFSRIFS